MAGLNKVQSSIERILDTGDFFDVSAAARRYFPQGRVLVDRPVHEAFVQWTYHNMRTFGVLIDEHYRLDRLVRSASAAQSNEKWVTFGCKTVDATSQEYCEKCKPLTLRRYDLESKTVWMICKGGNKPH
jgi:hypothetical protein